MELRIVRKINGLVGKCFPFDLFMDFVARFGHWLFVFYGVWLWFGGAERERFPRRVCALFTLASVALSSLLSFAIGRVWRRPRPFAADDRIWNFTAHRANASFPSNHTMNAAAVAFALYAFRMPGRAPAAGMAALLAFSRVYAGLHYVSDLLGGAVIAVLVHAALRRSPAFFRALRLAAAFSLAAGKFFSLLCRR